jgi:hypothetical protein
MRYIAEAQPKDTSFLERESLGSRGLCVLRAEALVAYLEEQGVRAVIRPAESPAYEADVEFGDSRVRVGDGFATVVRWDRAKERVRFGTTHFDDPSLIRDLEGALNGSVRVEA